MRNLKFLIKDLKDENWHVRQTAADALSKIGNRQAVESLITCLMTDGVDVIRRQAAEALGKIDNPLAVKPLIAALKDGDLCVRNYAVEALDKIGDKWKIEDKRAVEYLIPILNEHPDTQWRRRVAEVLKKITGRDFGLDHAKWQKWWKENKA